jgi:hypothetical protein
MKLGIAHRHIHATGFLANVPGWGQTEHSGIRMRVLLVFVDRWPSRKAFIRNDLLTCIAGRPIAPLERGLEVTAAGIALI